MTNENFMDNVTYLQYIPFSQYATEYNNIVLLLLANFILVKYAYTIFIYVGVFKEYNHKNQFHSQTIFSIISFELEV